MPEKIIKRDGRVVAFDQERIINAIFKAAKAVGGADRWIAGKLSQEVVDLLNEKYRDKLPSVEEVQDIVEKVLIENGHAKTAKAYILYRKQHEELRNFQHLLLNSEKMFQEYLGGEDWRINENSNMNYSLQGLNNHIISAVTSKYWLEKVYPEEIREAHRQGDLHIHDLSLLAPYCCGWDLADLLENGFCGVSQKVESAPPRHFRTALGQIVNFFYTLQGECYAEDTQVMTDSGWKYFYELKEKDRVYTLNNNNKIEIQKPLRFFAYDYNGEMYSFKNSKINLLVTPNHNMVVDQYSPSNGACYRRKIIKAKDFNPNIHFIPKNAEWQGKEADTFVLPEIKIKQYRYYGGQYEIIIKKKKEIFMDDWLAFFGFWLAEGSTYLQKGKRSNRNKSYFEYQVRISQNSGKTALEFQKILARLPFKYSKKQSRGKIEFCIWDQQLFSYLRHFGKAADKFIPNNIKNLSKRQLQILFDWMLKGDGYKGCGNITYATKSKKLADDMQEVTMKLGYAASIYKKKKGSFKWYKVAISRSKRNYLGNGVKKKNYKGKVYCLEVPNHTLYVRRKGQPAWCGNSAGAQALANFDTYLAPFIRYDGMNYREVKQAVQEFIFNLNVPTRVGFQTPFVNITMDVTVSSVLANQPVLIGGKVRKETYGEFQAEMDMLNLAFCEVMMEGDAKGRIFTFPIPTYNITPQFHWESPVAQKILEMTARYGIPYFANFINSDLSPEDVRSMCLFPEEDIFIRENGTIRKLTIGEFFAQSKGQQLDQQWFEVDKYVEALSLNPKSGQLEWVEIKRLLRVTERAVVHIRTSDGKYMRVSPEHLVAIYTKDGIRIKKANAIGTGDFLLVMRDGSNALIQAVDREARRDKVRGDKLHQQLPEFLLDQKYIRSEGGSMLYQSYGCKTVGLSTIDRCAISPAAREWLRNADFAVVEVADTTLEQLDYDQEFYDLELDKNHYFVHSQGNITHNCCRLRLDNRELRRRGGGLFGANPLTGSIGVVTINIPRLGYLSANEDEFFTRLKQLMEMSRDSLLIKRNVLEKMTEQGLYPYSSHYLRSVKERFGGYWFNHFNTIGLVGMNEGLLNFLGQDICSEEGRAFALKVLDFMRNLLLEFQAEADQLFNLEATPAEGTAYRLAKMDREFYPDIITAGQDSPYYTNSTQLPAGFTDDVFSALDLQEELQIRYTGGTVFHIFLGERIEDIEACKKLLQRIMGRYRIPYVTITPTFSICLDHGYLPGEQYNCSYCGKETEVWSRVVGFYRPVQNWNKGKQSEFKERKVFNF